MRIVKFMEDDFRQFSIYDNVRSIPNGFDGFKPSQRKVIHTLIKRGENAKEIKVAQLGALTALETDYHHGEASLFSTIIGMAQDYTGSNNMNFLAPNGSFGGRHSAVAAAPRYIFTEFTDNFRKIFKKEDDQILPKQYSDGEEIEPKMYYPILPAVLLNGAEGMGTGYACKILCYNPADIRDYVVATLAGKETKPLVPWYKGYKGNVFRNVTNEANPNQVVFEGVYEIVNTSTIRITEIPPGVELADYKKHLNKMKDASIITDWDDESQNDEFNFVCKVPRSLTLEEPEVIKTKFKLISRDSENVTVWDNKGHIVEHKDVHSLVNAFVDWRTGLVEVRRLKMIDVLTEDSRYTNEKLRFILYYLANTKEFHNKKKPELVAMLEAQGFTDHNRLMSIPLWSLTLDEVAKLQKEVKTIQDKLDALKKDTAKAMYTRELKELKFD